jgi:hypothetical protein
MSSLPSFEFMFFVICCLLLYALVRGVSDMPVTPEHVRFFILTCAEAFTGKRGRSGVLGFLRGETTPSTKELARTAGLEQLFGVLKVVDLAIAQGAMAALITGGMLEVRKVESRGNELPLLFITDRGREELKRLGEQGLGPVRVEDKMFTVFSDVGQLMDSLRSEAVELSPRERQCVQLLGKALGLNPVIHMANSPGRRQFVHTLSIALQRNVFAYLPEMEAQCLRAACGIDAKQQLGTEELREAYGEIDISALAHRAAARVAGRGWPEKNQLVSVLGFLAITQP